MSQMRASIAGGPQPAGREPKVLSRPHRGQRKPAPSRPPRHLPSPGAAVLDTSPEALKVSQRDTLVVEHLPAVELIARQMAHHMPGHVELGDLIGAGAIGLIRAAEQYNPSSGVRFRTYADYRIRGAIYDGLRDWDPEPRVKRRKIKWLDKMYTQAEQQFCRAPSDATMMEFLGLDGEEFYSLVQENTAVAVTSLEEGRENANEIPRGARLDTIADPNHTPADQIIHAEQMKRILAQAIDQLPEQERLVVTLYYYEELVMREIAAILGVTESRVSQIHKGALAKLRKQLNAPLHGA